MKRLLPGLVIIAVALGGCGGTPTPSSSKSVQTLGAANNAAHICQPGVPAHMGECVQHRFGLTPQASAPANGWDISVYQGSPSFPGSLRFVYNQVGDGASYRDPNFSSNCAREKRQNIRCGAYLFVRPGDAYGQALVISSVVSQTNLPPALDVEVPGAYQELCPIAGDLKADFHVPIVVAYTAPGLWWGGSACGTRLWGAEWGTAGYAFSGWSSYVAQQTCGTCVVDEDADHGLLALVRPKPKPPTHAQTVARWHRELLAHYRLRKLLWQDLARERCPRPSKARYRALCGRWGAHLRVEQREILRFHHKHVF